MSWKLQEKNTSQTLNFVIARRIAGLLFLQFKKMRTLLFYNSPFILRLFFKLRIYFMQLWVHRLNFIYVSCNSPFISQNWLFLKIMTTCHCKAFTIQTLSCITQFLSYNSCNFNLQTYNCNFIAHNSEKKTKIEKQCLLFVQNKWRILIENRKKSEFLDENVLTLYLFLSFKLKQASTSNT